MVTEDGWLFAICHVKAGPANHVLVRCFHLQVIDAWEPVTETDVQTPLEVYAELLEDGYDVVSVADKAEKVSDLAFHTPGV